MLSVAPVLAGNAPEEAQSRALARYTFLWADSLLEWARRWRKQLARSERRHVVLEANRARREVRAFADLLAEADGVRDYLVAKRQPLAALRADDMELTARMWVEINPLTVNEIWAAAIGLYDRLRGITSPTESVVACSALPVEAQARIRAALPVREPYWYLATDTGADFRSHTLPAAQGGELGRLIAQINDVALHLDTLLRLAPITYGHLPYDWFVRSMLMVELAALLDLTIGPPWSANPSGRPTLRTLCRFGRPKHAAGELDRLRSSISIETRDYVRWCRDKLGAHLDRDLPIRLLREHLLQLDYRGMVRLAEHVLNWLDALGAAELDLKLLLMGERKIRSWPLDPAGERAHRTPDPRAIPGSLAGLFRSVDSPYISGAASSLGSPVLAGICAGRRPVPREKAELPGTWEDTFLAKWRRPSLSLPST